MSSRNGMTDTTTIHGKQSSNKALPQTGNDNNFAMMVLGLLSASFATLLGLRKRS
ncbi:MAG TPA: LPXTG cell wall anchor domain-containing protein [Candidatus Limosilactobacillus merdigallinarum]|uniref:LPXTG cell wall anchor domain-containing protein n=1 Tax=Candidatus Limosilactobacillus merdigallinarum TaxID=2838652 RepID=A0A9D2AL83_9LACO|nr:LPXTG cell wall anchor domain-containing protein [Candidatus Limosilactobacillus merdigallinarum]